MFCYQCEQAVNSTGCEKFGVCGKDPTTAALQDLLVYETMLVGRIAHKLDALGIHDEEASKFIMDALFVTVTNVDFDPDDVVRYIKTAREIKGRLFEQYSKKVSASCCSGHELCSGDLGSFEASDSAKLEEEGAKYSPKADIERYGADLGGLKWLAVYGLKGTAAYVHHAMLMGRKDTTVFDFFNEALDALLERDLTAEKLLGLNLKIGEINLRAMELLDEANTSTYGHPEPTSVRITPIKGKAILVSGHDLPDLEKLLKQTEGKGINVYTHGEMLPCNAYPELKKYKHLVGNYGGAWQDQQKEFAAFPGAILMTTNCIQKPTSYMKNIFTSGLVQWPGVLHISDGDFAPVIESALAMPGFESDEPEKRITIGFAHKSVLDAAGKVIELVKAGKIKHFFLVGGCDGAKPGRNYYTEFAENAPLDTVILTLACGKFRFNKLEFGDIDGIPRLLDCGQCNDAYSAVQIAVALSNAFDTDVNSLPLSMILSWYEQKAVCILLTLLYLGIKNIKLGPTLPAFVGPEVLKILVDKFAISPIGDAKEDIAAILKR